MKRKILTAAACLGYAYSGERDGSSLHIRSDMPHGWCWFCERTKPYPWEPS